MPCYSLAALYYAVINCQRLMKVSWAWLNVVCSWRLRVSHSQRKLGELRRCFSRRNRVVNDSLIGTSANRNNERYRNYRVKKRA